MSVEQSSMTIARTCLAFFGTALRSLAGSPSPPHIAADAVFFPPLWGPSHNSSGPAQGGRVRNQQVPLHKVDQVPTITPHDPVSGDTHPRRCTADCGSRSRAPRMTSAWMRPPSGSPACATEWGYGVVLHFLLYAFSCIFLFRFCSSRMWCAQLLEGTLGHRASCGAGWVGQGACGRQNRRTMRCPPPLREAPTGRTSLDLGCRNR